MTQPLIDLLPDSIRARSQAGVVAGRYVVSLLIAVVLLGLAATHSRLMLELARQRLRVAEEQADIVLSAEAKADHIRQMLDDTRNYIRRYELIALPLEISRVLATVINAMPETATLDRIDLHAGVVRSGRSARGRTHGETDGPVPRALGGELSGLALTDHEVAEFVNNLIDIGLFQQVSLDFSRSRSVRGKSARGFRISFHTDLDARFDILDLNDEEASTRRHGTAHVQ